MKNKKKSFYFEDYTESELIDNNKSKSAKILSSRVNFLFIVFFKSNEKSNTNIDSTNLNTDIKNSPDNILKEAQPILPFANKKIAKNDKAVSINAKSIEVLSAKIEEIIEKDANPLLD